MRFGVPAALADASLYAERQAKFVAAVLDGLTRRQAAAAASIPWSTLCNWMARGREEIIAAKTREEIGTLGLLVIEVELAESEIARECLGVLKRRGLYSDDDKIAADTAKWLLERRHPLQWGRAVARPDLVVTVDESGKPKAVKVDDLTGEDPPV